MAATKNTQILSAFAQLALSRPQYQKQIVPILRRVASKMLSPQTRLRVDLRRLAATHPNPRVATEVQGLLEQRARFEEGKTVDVAEWLRSKGLDDAAKEWEENTEKYRDQFKS